MTGEHTHSFTDPEVEPKMALQDVLWYSFLHFYHLDSSNAPMHTNKVRFSPITFRLAEQVWFQFPNMRINQDLRSVILDSGQYEEDPGR